EVVDRKGSAFFRVPALRNGPEQSGVGGRALGKSGPLSVSHDPAAITRSNTAEFAAGDQRRFWRAWVAALGGHYVGKIQPASFDLDQGLTLIWHRVRGLLSL